MSIDLINKQYDNLYSSKYNSLVQAKEQNLSNIAREEKQGKERYYNDRNTVSSESAMRTQQTRDYMAKNNLMQSGENVDAMLRNNTDLANGIGKVRDNESRFLDGIGEQRNTINRNFQGDEVALRGEVEAARTKEIIAYQERLRQEQLQREMQERQLAAQAAARAASSSANKGPSASQQKKDLKAELQIRMKDPKLNHTVQQYLESDKNYIVDNYGLAYYKELEDMYWKDMGDYYAKKPTSGRNQNTMY